MKQKILIAEDDKAIVEVMKIILQEADYDTLTLEDGKNVITTVKTHNPALILLDIWLSGEDGGEIAKTLKSEKETKKIPIIMISANNETEKIAQEAGADGFLKKPFDIADLLDVVQKNLS